MNQLNAVEWSQEFERMVEKYSQGNYSRDLDLARHKFFEKIGRAHENQNSIYDSVSQNFLEYFLFHHLLEGHEKPPIVVEYELSGETDWLRQVMFHRWSLFEVLDINKSCIELKDLLFSQIRTLDRQSSADWISSWRPEKHQIVQARLFPLKEVFEPETYSCSYVWLHYSSESEELKKLCEKRSQIWSDHLDLLKSLMEVHIRSLSLSEQMSAMRTKNFFYQELYKRYA